MLKIAAATVKELLLLRRDRAGLLVLFFMPAILVTVITLVQENVMELTGQKKTELLLLDLDRGELGRALQHELAKTNLEIVPWDGPERDAGDLRAAVLKGKYQVGLVVPEGASERLQQEAERLVRDPGQEPAGSVPGVDVFFDPGIMAGLRSGVTAQLRMALTTVAMAEKLKILDRVLKEAMGGFVPPESASGEVPALPRLFNATIVELREEGDPAATGHPVSHDPVQQNVPAWALFGMFFTAIPIAGSILQERTSGIWVRLNSLPVSPLVLFLGKGAAYMGVCLCQFTLIAILGRFLFPAIGLPAFTLSANPVAVLLTVLCSSLAACGYGIFLGMACNSYEQASTVGSTTVVAAAAIGGVMVPVYAMPRLMQHLSVISPLNWGLTAFQDLLLRGAALPVVLDDLGRLFLFFIACALLSWKLAGMRHSPL